MRRIVLTLSLLAVALPACSRAPEPLLIGAVYPTSGGQGQGGLDEYHGVQLAAEMINERGGIDGRPVRLRLASANAPDQVPHAMRRMRDAGVPVIIGSHGSTISRPVADEAQRDGTVFWETGAVGELSMAAMQGDRVFRFAPTGGTLGRSAVRFARDVLLPKFGTRARTLRYAVTYVDDVYGEAVGLGAVDELRASGLNVAGVFPYKLDQDFGRLARDVEAADTDVLFVSAYLQDGLALRRALVKQKVPLVASVGTSSSYCMHQFGAALGKDAVGLFASDKIDGDVMDPTRLAPEAAEVLRDVRARFRKRYGAHMAAGALTGFSGAWALFNDVLPRAASMQPDAIARAARSTDIPEGALPNGSGLRFAALDARDTTENLRATSVIWEWVRPAVREVVWPPAFATSPVVPLSLT